MNINRRGFFSALPIVAKAATATPDVPTVYGEISADFVLTSHPIKDVEAVYLEDRRYTMIYATGPRGTVHFDGQRTTHSKR